MGLSSRYSLLSAFLLLNWSCEAQQLLQGQRIAVLEKHEIPGVGTLDAPGEPVIGMGGHIGFVARVSGKGKAVVLGKPGKWKVIAMEGDPVPGGKEGMTHRLSFVKLWVNSVGRATLQADADWKDQPLPQKWPRTLFSTDDNGALQPLAIQWMPMPHSPEGFVFDRIDTFAAYGWTVWRTHPKRGPDTPPINSSIFAAKNGEIQVLLRAGIRPRGVDDPKATLNDVAGPDQQGPRDHYCPDREIIIRRSPPSIVARSSGMMVGPA